MGDKIKNILILVGGCVIVWMTWNPLVIIDVQEKVITLPAKRGEIEYVEVETVIRDTTYLPSKEEVVVVDQKYKMMYEEAKDSLERQELYLEAIRIREYNKVFVDNDTINISGNITTRGSLLGYKFNYLVKESQLTYTPEVEFKLPRMSLGIGVEAGVPTRLGDKFVLKGNLKLNRGSNGYSISYDTNNTWWVGINKTFKIY